MGSVTIIRGTTATNRRTRFGAFASLVVLVFAAVGDGAPAASLGRSERLLVQVAPWGPSQAEVERQQQIILDHPLVRQHLAGDRARVLTFELLEERDLGPDTPPSRYRAAIYDYVSERTLVVKGDLLSQHDVSTEVTDEQPLPSSDEFEEAVRLARRDRTVGPAIDSGAVVPYRPMPPLVEDPPIPGRTLTIGLRPADSALERSRHEIVGVHMATGTVIHFDGGAPPTSAADEHMCGPPSAGQGATARGTAGQSLITVTDGQQELWRMVVIRPANSSGTNGSGVEVRYVDHRGERVLDRGHAPILNVQYAQGDCGPFRDWLWEEGMFDAQGTTAAAGFQRCSEPPRHIDSVGSDVGNFRGVAVYLDGDELVLMSELEAGWYRYLSEWHFLADGTIQPRFRFSAVADSCTCSTHTHHVYWRLDLGPGLRHFQEFNDPPLSGEENWTPLAVETRRMRDETRSRSWRAMDGAGRGYSLQPGARDGVADEFGVSDLWVLRYALGEIDDGRQLSTDDETAPADLDRFLDGESVANKDIVVWYAAHVLHEANDDDAGLPVGPDLIPLG